MVSGLVAQGMPHPDGGRAGPVPDDRVVKKTVATDGFAPGLQARRSGRAVRVPAAPPAAADAVV